MPALARRDVFALRSLPLTATSQGRALITAASAVFAVSLPWPSYSPAAGAAPRLRGSGRAAAWPPRPSLAALAGTCATVAAGLASSARWRRGPRRGGRVATAVAPVGQPGSAEAGTDEATSQLLVSRRSVTAALVAATLSLLGFTLPTPVLPLLRAQFGLSPSQVGLISSSSAAGMLFAVLVLPAWSDSSGRVPVAGLALLATALGHFAQGLVLRSGLGFQAFLVVRLLTGLFAGCNPIFKAYLADVVPSSRLSTFMVYREAAATVAYVIGPVVGGYLASTSGAAGPLFATSVAHVLAALIVFTSMEESVRLGEKQGVKKASDMGAKDERVLWKLVWWTMVISFFYIFGQTCFAAFFPLLMHDRFAATAQEIGSMSTSFAMLALTFQVLLYGRVSRALGPIGVASFGALAIGAGLAGLGTAGVPLWVASTAYAIGVACFPAIIPTLLARSVPKARRGLALGADSIVNNFCRVIAPLILAALYARSPGFAFQVAGAMMLLVVATLCALGQSRAVRAALYV